MSKGSKRSFTFVPMIPDEAVLWMQDRGIAPHRGDLFNTASLTQATKEADGVIHLGAILGPGWGEGDRIAVHALLDALDGSGKPFVYTSGAPIYGFQSRSPLRGVPIEPGWPEHTCSKTVSA